MLNVLDWSYYALSESENVFRANDHVYSQPKIHLSWFGWQTRQDQVMLVVALN